MKRIWLVAILLFFSAQRLEALDRLRAASGGFTTAIHAVLWAAYEEKIFPKYGLDVEYLALNTGRLAQSTRIKGEIFHVETIFGKNLFLVGGPQHRVDGGRE